MSSNDSLTELTMMLKFRSLAFSLSAIALTSTVAITAASSARACIFSKNSGTAPEATGDAPTLSTTETSPTRADIGKMGAIGAGAAVAGLAIAGMAYKARRANAEAALEATEVASETSSEEVEPFSIPVPAEALSKPSQVEAESEKDLTPVG